MVENLQNRNLSLLKKFINSLMNSLLDIKELTLYNLSICQSLFSMLSYRQGGDWSKKTSLNPVTNPQQALQCMNRAGTVAAISLFCSEGYLFFATAAIAVTEAVEKSWCMG